MIALSYSGTIEPKVQRVLTLRGITVDIVQATRRKLHIDMAIKELFQIAMEWRSHHQYDRYSAKEDASV